MEQIVTVRALYPDGTAEVACRRASACSGDCGHCGGCTNAQTVLVRAYNPIRPSPGTGWWWSPPPARCWGLLLRCICCRCCFCWEATPWREALAEQLGLPWV
ncbi:MAG: SoxR reducing system RseC family protein [Oscillospiraceae bacterium]